MYVAVNIESIKGDQNKDCGNHKVDEIPSKGGEPERNGVNSADELKMLCGSTSFFYQKHNK